MTNQTSLASGRLSAQIDSLQDGFRRLSRAASVGDLAGQFLGVVGRFFPGAGLGLFYRRERGAAWERLTGEDVPDAAAVLALPPDTPATASVIQENGGTVSIVQRLVDRSFLGVVLTLKGSGYGEIDLVSLRLFVHLFENAYQDLLHRRKEKGLVFSLNQRVLQLNSLIDTGIEISRLVQGASPERLALERAAALTCAARGVVHIAQHDTLKEEILFPAGSSPGDTLYGALRIASSFTFGQDQYTFELFEKESRNGVEAFDETDQLLLDALARQVHASLENRYLHQQALEKQKIEQDIAVAASIQQRIIPATLPEIPGFDVAGINLPSKFVGGDYYDCLPLPDGRYALVMADVSGKGVPAALLVSSLHAYLSAYLEGVSSLPDLAVRLNRAICRASTDDRFITASFALLSPETGELESLNAGHPPAYLLRADGSIRELGEGGVALGMLDLDFPFQSEKVRIEPGERLLLYTDGVTEATADDGTLYDSASPLVQFALKTKPARAGAFIQELISDIRRFTGSAPQSDDITALYLLRR